MKDLISLNVALPDTVENGMINFRKVAHLSAIFKELWELQNSSPNIIVSTDMVNTLKVYLKINKLSFAFITPVKFPLSQLSLDKAYTEDEIYEMSMTREPRVNSSVSVAPNKITIGSEVKNIFKKLKMMPDLASSWFYIHFVVF